MALPKVEMRQEPHSSTHVAWCYEVGCVWLYSNVVKTDVQYHQRLHRRKHKDQAARG